MNRWSLISRCKKFHPNFPETHGWMRKYLGRYGTYTNYVIRTDLFGVSTFSCKLAKGNTKLTKWSAFHALYFLVIKCQCISAISLTTYSNVTSKFLCSNELAIFRVYYSLFSKRVGLSTDFHWSTATTGFLHRTFTRFVYQWKNNSPTESAQG